MNITFHLHKYISNNPKTLDRGPSQLKMKNEGIHNTKVSPHKHQVMFFSAKSSFYFYSEGCAYLSSFIMTCKLADDSVVSGKVLHEDWGDFSKVSRTPGS